MSDMPSLLEQITEYATTHDVTLPMFDPMAQRLLAAPRSEQYDIGQIVDGIEREPALAAGVLKSANSAFFGGLSEVRTIKAAILRLGMKHVAQLVLLESERGRYRATAPVIRELMPHLWHHARGAAMAAGWLAQRLQYRHLVEEAFVGGLIHDVGKLLQLRVLDQMMADRPFENRLSRELILEVLEQGHAEAGAQLLRRWQLPQVYVDIVEHHHAATVAASNVGLQIVRLANLTCHRVGMGYKRDDSIELSATSEAVALGLEPITVAELEVLLEDSLAQAA